MITQVAAPVTPPQTTAPPPLPTPRPGFPGPGEGAGLPLTASFPTGAITPADPEGRTSLYEITSPTAPGTTGMTPESCPGGTDV